MFSLSKWLSLPSISLPASIQSRFVSFFLKKSLGHLVKPGQLDPAQIESQIGSGYVHINDIELDQHAFDEYLVDSPLAFHTGSIGKISIRLPWAEFLSKPIELSISDLSLNFLCSNNQDPEISKTRPLSESVGSLAQSFIHDELALPEDTPYGAVAQLPGSLDAQEMPDTLKSYYFGSMAAGKDTSVEGVSLIATLIERVLSKVRFNATKVSIRVTFPSDLAIYSYVDEISFKTQDSRNLPGKRTEDGEVRILSLNRISMHMEDYHVVPSPQSNRSSIIHSESSSVSDDRPPDIMSQSLVSLPPPGLTRSVSPDSSMYHSATSSIQTGATFHRGLSANQPDVTFLSLSGAIVLKLQTPRINLVDETEEFIMDVKPHFDELIDELKLTVDIPPVGIALEPRHVERLLHGFSMLKPRGSFPSQTRHANLFPVTINFHLNVRSITILALRPTLSPSSVFPISKSDNLSGFFSHPTVTNLPFDSIRLHLELIRVSSVFTPDSSTESTDSSRKNKLIEAQIQDVSMFSFKETADTYMLVSPILISDHNLNVQYDRHVEYPVFDVLDWTIPSELNRSAGVNRWRTRPVSSQRNTNERTSSCLSPPCIGAQLHIGSSDLEDAYTVNIVPLHVFLDPEAIERFMEFDKVLRREQASRSASSTPIDGQRSPRITKEMSSNFRGLDTASDVKENMSCPEGILKVEATISFLRIEIRCSPLPDKSTRSGVTVIDFHDVQFKQTPKTSKMSHKLFDNFETVMAMLTFDVLKVAAALPGDHSANGFLSIRNVSSSEKSSEPKQNREGSEELGVCVRRHSSNSTWFSFDVQLPLLVASLSKPVLDNIVYWADDLSKRLLLADQYLNFELENESNLIGSKYFVKGFPIADSNEMSEEHTKSELVVKIFIGRGNIHLLVPRNDSNGLARRLEITVIDTNILSEIKPEGKDEAVLTVGIADLCLLDTSHSGHSECLLQLTGPYEEFEFPIPIVKLRYVTIVDEAANTKMSKLKLTLSGFTYQFNADISWITDLSLFAKTPDGTFDTVVPTEHTKLSVNIRDAFLHIAGKTYSGASVIHLGDLSFDTDIIGRCSDMSFVIECGDVQILLVDNRDCSGTDGAGPKVYGMEYWKRHGYIRLATLEHARINIVHQYEPQPSTAFLIDDVRLALHACADTLPALSSLIDDLSSFWRNDIASDPERPIPISLAETHSSKEDVFASVVDHAFTRPIHLGSAPDMIYDDLPRNLDYLDSSFRLAGGVRELHDDMFSEDAEEIRILKDSGISTTGIVSNVRGETIRMLDDRGINVVEGHFESVHAEADDKLCRSMNVKLRIRIANCNISFCLYEGYDWAATRKVIKQEIKAIRKRLVKIRQLLASGQASDDSVEDTHVVLFNSVSIGLSEDPDDMDHVGLIAAIDAELGDDVASEVASQSPWQSFDRRRDPPPPRQGRLRMQSLERSRECQIEFSILGMHAEFDSFYPNNHTSSRTLVNVRDLEILDHMKTSTWKKFLTSLRTDFRGNVRETDSNMFRAELCIVHPVPGLSSEEGRLKAKILPIKLHVDQDALDFMKKFFSFQRSEPVATTERAGDQIYFQHIEVFPVDLKLDYKPKRVDYRAIREGKTIELMNFFHFDGAEITLRHITLSGVTGWSRLFDTLNDLWTPDVKANQLADIISGVSPVRSFVNVGSGVADLVLLPIAHYKKDKRVVRGLQKGTTSFVKTTAMEAVKLGARLATGTQVILEQAETVLGGQGQFRKPITAEALDNSNEEQEQELISKFADQPQDIREGLQLAYRSLSKNLTSAAQTILAVPMEVYERSGNEGPVRAVIRAVPIAVLKPMIGATEAVSKTLIGLRNTMDPDVKHENEAKYKQP